MHAFFPPCVTFLRPFSPAFAIPKAPPLFRAELSPDLPETVPCRSQNSDLPVPYVRPTSIYRHSA
ncbi:hypothetical protein BaRGS_00023034, partial [Batillaria attramentaria]